MKKKRHIAFWIIFPIVFILISALLAFYIDLANGPLACFIVEIILLASLAAIRILFLNKKFWMKLLIWVGFFALTFANLMFDKPVVQRFRAVGNNPEVSEVLDLTSGKIQGYLNDDKDVQIYAGIRYATAERWKLPKEYTWEGTIQGDYFGPKSMQPASTPIMNSLVDIYAAKGWHPNYNMMPEQDRAEDALYLNIWKPNTTETNLPIMVYIHGGSLTNGTGAYYKYNGEPLAKLGVL